MVSGRCGTGGRGQGQRQGRQAHGALLRLLDRGTPPGVTGSRHRRAHRRSPSAGGAGGSEPSAARSAPLTPSHTDACPCAHIAHGVHGVRTEFVPGHGWGTRKSFLLRGQRFGKGLAIGQVSRWQRGACCEADECCCCGCFAGSGGGRGLLQGLGSQVQFQRRFDRCRGRRADERPPHDRPRGELPVRQRPTQPTVRLGPGQRPGGRPRRLADPGLARPRQHRGAVRRRRDRRAGDLVLRGDLDGRDRQRRRLPGDR